MQSIELSPKQGQYQPVVANVYETPEEMLDFMNRWLSKSRMEKILEHHDIFSNNTEEPYIDKIIYIVRQTEYLMRTQSSVMYHYTHGNDKFYSTQFVDGRRELITEFMRIYFILYYETVHDDTNLEDMMRKLKPGTTLYLTSFPEIIHKRAVRDITPEIGLRGLKLKMTLNQSSRVFWVDQVNKHGCLACQEATLHTNFQIAKTEFLFKLKKNIRTQKKNLYANINKYKEIMKLAEIPTDD